MDIYYSIIIPHKNSLDLLKRCVNSIPERNDVEIIIVDDNSDIARSEFPYQERKNVHYLFLDEKQSNFAGKARNEGMKIAKGKWMLFADADDYFTDYLNVFLDKYKNNTDYDIVYLSVNMVNDFGGVEPYFGNEYIKRYLEGRLYSEKNLRYRFWTPWSRMVRSDLIRNNNLYFEETPTGNDIYFGLTASRYATSIGCDTGIIYNYYRPFDGSITDRYYTIDTLNTRIRQIIKVNKLYDEVGYIFKIPLYRRFAPSIDMTRSQANEYKRVRNVIFKDNKVSLVSELYTLVVNACGILLGIK